MTVAPPAVKRGIGRDREGYGERTKKLGLVQQRKTLDARDTSAASPARERESQRGCYCGSHAIGSRVIQTTAERERPAVRPRDRAALGVVPPLRRERQRDRARESKSESESESESARARARERERERERTA